MHCSVFVVHFSEQCNTLYCIAFCINEAFVVFVILISFHALMFHNTGNRSKVRIFDTTQILLVEEKINKCHVLNQIYVTSRRLT